VIEYAEYTEYERTGETHWLGSSIN